MNSRIPIYSYLTKKIPNSEDAMTSVITTVLIIAIVMGLIIGPYLTLVIPQEIKNNEAAHLKDVEESFLDLRSSVNTELEKAIPNMALTTPIKLGTDDENLFVLGGSGSLVIDPTESVISICSYFDPLSIYARGSGIIRYTSKNLYHPDKSYILEASGIITSQRDSSVMTIDPVVDFTRRRVIRTVGIDTGFGKLAGAYNRLENLFLINTISKSLTFDRARVTWIGGNASALTRFSIGIAPLEWSGSAPSGVMINFTSNFNIINSIETMALRFDADLHDATVIIELFTTGNKRISNTWPVTALDSVAHAYSIDVPSENAKKFGFKNICDHTITIKNISVSWTGSANLYKINIENHGGDVWNVPFPGEKSPATVSLTKDSVFQSGEEGVVKLYFNGIIDDEDINIKFSTENSTNMAMAKFPVSLNETYINASFSIVSLVTNTGDKITTGGKNNKVIKTTLISAEENRYLWANGEAIVFDITTKNGDAWFEYFNRTLSSDKNLIWDFDGPGAFEGDYYLTMNEVGDDFANVKLVINSIYKLDCTIGIIKVNLA